MEKKLAKKLQTLSNKLLKRGFPEGVKYNNYRGAYYKAETGHEHFFPSDPSANEVKSIEWEPGILIGAISKDTEAYKLAPFTSDDSFHSKHNSIGYIPKLNALVATNAHVMAFRFFEAKLLEVDYDILLSATIIKLLAYGDGLKVYQSYTKNGYPDHTIVELWAGGEMVYVERYYYEPYHNLDTVLSEYEAAKQNADLTNVNLEIPTPTGKNVNGYGYDPSTFHLIAIGKTKIIYDIVTSGLGIETTYIETPIKSEGHGADFGVVGFNAHYLSMLKNIWTQGEITLSLTGPNSMAIAEKENWRALIMPYLLTTNEIMPYILTTNERDCERYNF
jgi:hypothetical protein